jgi:hypothetical protein
MDLQLVFGVLWRFKWVVLPGLALATALAFLSLVKVSPDGNPPFTYRTQPQYESDTTVFVTTHGFPWGALNLRAGTDANAPHGSVDSDVLRNLASLYTQLALGGPIVHILEKEGPINGEIGATQLFAPDSTTLPLIALSAVSTSPARAKGLAQRHLDALQSWLQRNQEEAGINSDNRVVLEPVNGPSKARLIQGRKKTMAVLIFLATSMAVVGLAFILENLRPRARAAASESEPESLANAHAQRPAA